MYMHISEQHPETVSIFKVHLRQISVNNVLTVLTPVMPLVRYITNSLFLPVSPKGDLLYSKIDITSSE